MRNVVIPRSRQGDNSHRSVSAMGHHGGGGGRGVNWTVIIFDISKRESTDWSQLMVQTTD